MCKISGFNVLGNRDLSILRSSTRNMEPNTKESFTYVNHTQEIQSSHQTYDDSLPTDYKSIKKTDNTRQTALNDINKQRHEHTYTSKQVEKYINRQKYCL